MSMLQSATSTVLDEIKGKSVELIGLDQPSFDTNRWWAAFMKFLDEICGKSSEEVQDMGLNLCGQKLVLKGNHYILKGTKETSQHVPAVPSKETRSVTNLRADVEYGIYQFVYGGTQVYQLVIAFPDGTKLVVSKARNRLEIEVNLIRPQ